MKTNLIRAMALAGCALGFSPCIASSAADATVDWHKAAIDDLAAAREILLDNSPGGVPGEDANFLANIDQATKLASADAQSASTYEGYRFTLERFVNVFQDDHLWVDFKEPAHIRWPGFMVGYRNDSFEIVATANQAAAPIGAVLTGCDGASVQTMANRRLTTYAGRWTVLSSRRHVAPLLLVDMGNPFIERPAGCTFAQNGRTWTTSLAWEDIDPDQYRARLKAAQQIAPEPKGGVRQTEDGGYWVGIPTLNALNPDAVAGLEALMKDIEAKAPAIRTAKYFVIDLRGNSGGNTFVALRVLNAIWGEGAVSAVRPRNLRAEWRASAGNIAYLQAVAPVLKQLFGEQSLAYTGLNRILQGFQQSVAENRAIYIDGDEYSILSAGERGPHYAVVAKPFLFTDGGCISSCLNLVDMVLKLPHVVQIGDETASDTFYLENRPNPLPSGHAVLQFPIKLYRNRERLLNESHKPAYYWDGDMSDNAMLEHWVATLAAK